MSPPPAAPRLTAAALDGLPEPVRRYLGHAIADGAPLGTGTRLLMHGRVKAGAWLPFTAEEACAPRSFHWRARVGPARFAPLVVTDRYGDGAGRTEGRLLGRRVFGAAGSDTTRSAAGRAALEAAIWAPGALLATAGVHWRAEAGDHIAAAWHVGMERPEVHLHIDAHGAVRSVVAQRWGDTGGGAFGYVPCGAEVHAERRFGDLLVPSAVTVAWWFGTPREAPFFRAGIDALERV